MGEYRLGLLKGLGFRVHGAHGSPCLCFGVGNFAAIGEANLPARRRELTAENTISAIIILYSYCYSSFSFYDGYCYCYHYCYNRYFD